MFTIKLSNLLFFGYHGLYEEEKKLGGEYEVNITVNHLSEVITSLENTIDYNLIYKLVKEKMQEHTLLLEALAKNIADKIFEVFPQICAIEISIKKLRPPVISFEGNVSVIYKMKRNE